MNDDKNDQQQKHVEKESRDARRVETNKTDPQLTELRGFTDPDEPLEEEGTVNPLTDDSKESE